MLVGQRDDGGDFFGALAEHHQLGWRHVEGRLVAAMLLTNGQRRGAAVTEARLERLEHRWRHRARLDLGKQMRGDRCVHGYSFADAAQRL
jgi:hypothetical protein